MREIGIYRLYLYNGEYVDFGIKYTSDEFEGMKNLFGIKKIVDTEYELRLWGGNSRWLTNYGVEVHRMSDGYHGVIIDGDDSYL